MKSTTIRGRKVEDIPGFRIHMGQKDFDRFLLSLEKRFSKSYKAGIITYCCSRGGNAKGEQSYDVRTNNRRVLRRLEKFALSYIANN